MAVSRGTGRSSKARHEPYPTGDASTSGKHSKSGSPQTNDDKENQSPQAKPKDSASKKKEKKSSDRSELPNSYLDIPLDEVKGEVPVYENAAAIRRKLNTLIEKKTKIPGSNKTFNKTTLSKELEAVAAQTHTIETIQKGVSNGGPSPKALATFLKKQGSMAGGDSEAYYFGNMLLEKLRIWNGEKKTKAREKVEKEFPNGRQRVDPAHLRILCRANERPSRNEVANMAR